MQTTHTSMHIRLARLSSLMLGKALLKKTQSLKLILVLLALALLLPLPPAKSSATAVGAGGSSAVAVQAPLPPTISKAFGAPTIPSGGTTSLIVTITNPNAGVALTGVAFTDTLPAGLAFASPSALASTCGGVAVAATGPPASLSLSGGSLAASASCTVSANVTGIAAGTNVNSVTVTSTNGGTGNTATATIIVLAAPVITKAFGAPTIPVGGTTSLTVTITNPNAGVALTGVAFTDTLPAGLTFASPSALASTCGGVAVAATGPPASLSASGGSLAAGASCTVSANVTGIAAGTNVNAVTVSSTNGGTGNTATATVVILAPPTISKAFGALNIALGGTTSLTLTLTNPNSTALTGVAFTDTFPAGLIIASPNGLSSTCGGTTTATAGPNGAISLANGTIGASNSCTITLNVTGALPGVQVNTTGTVTTTNGGTGNTATSVVTVGAPPLGVAIVDPFGCTGPGDALTVTVTLSNPTPLAQIVSFASILPAGLVGVPGSGTSTVGGPPTVTGTSASFGPTTLAAGQTVTVTYQVQVADVLPSTLLTISTQPTFGGVTTPAITANTTVNCPGVGPGLPYPATSEVSDQKAGSVLVYNLYSSSSSPTAQNTRINLTNINPTLPIAVHLFFVDGSTCSVADANICLTPNQTSSFLASDLDPGSTGYIVAIASDPVTGCPVSFNFLIGDEYVKLASGHAANLGAEAFAAIAGGLTFCNTNSTTAVLAFDGVSYNRVPRVLAVDNVPSRADGNDTLLVINRFGGNLATGASTLINLFGIFYDDTETALSFGFGGSSSSPGTCQFRSSLSNSFPRLTPRFEQFIPAGRSGWAKIYSQADIGLLGAVLNFNPNSTTIAGAFGQGHNLHKLMLTPTVTLTIPIFPPNC